MKNSVFTGLKRSTADWIGSVCGVPVGEGSVRIPSRDADVSCSFFVREKEAVPGIAERLSEALDSSPGYARVRERNGWILLDLSAEFYDGIARSYLSVSGFPENADYCCHRMRMLSRYPSCGCPDHPDVQRALLLCLAAAEDPSVARRERAERALLSMALRERPADRTALLSRCGDVARAAVRLLYY